MVVLLPLAGRQSQGCVCVCVIHILSGIYMEHRRLSLSLSLFLPLLICLLTVMLSSFS